MEGRRTPCPRLNKNAAPSTATGTRPSGSMRGDVTTGSRASQRPGLLSLRCVVRVQTVADAVATAPTGAPHSMRHILEVLPKEFELRDLVLNRRELFANQGEQAWPQRRARSAVEGSRQHSQPLERNSQRAGPADEAQSFKGRFVILSVARRRAGGHGQHPDLFVVSNSLRRYTGALGDLANGERARHPLASPRFCLAQR